MDYYYSLNNQPQGPVPLERLHELHRTGVITRDTLVVPVGAAEWKPYSTIGALPHDLAGSAVPAEVPGAGAAPDGELAASPSQSAITPATAPAIANAPSYGPVSTAQPGYNNFVWISWALIGVTALVSVIPILGCFSWVMLVPVVITCVILGVLTLQRGGTIEGISILVGAIVVLPLITIIAPILTTALFGAITGD